MTRRLLRLLVACLAAGVVSIVVARPAAAAFQFNGAPIVVTAAGRSPVFTESTGSGSRFNCVAAQIGMTVQSHGTGIVPRSRASFASCSWLSPLTFTQVGDWPISMTALLNNGRIIGLALTVTLPSGGGLRASFGGCTFGLAGTITSLQTTAATTPPALLTITSLPLSGPALTLAVEGARGCGGTGFANGDLVRLNVNLSLSTSLSGTLV